MSQRQWDSLVNRALVHQARSAPRPDGLLETVKRGSRRRGRRNGILTAIAVLAVGAVGAGTWYFPTPSAAVAAFGADAVGICVAYEDDRLDAIMITERVGGDNVNSDIAETTDQGPRLEHGMAGGEHGIDITVLAGSLDDQAIAGATAITVGGRSAVIGDGGDGARVLAIAADALIVRLEFSPPTPDDSALLGWADNLTVSADPADCGY